MRPGLYVTYWNQASKTTKRDSLARFKNNLIDSHPPSLSLSLYANALKAWVIYFKCQLITFIYRINYKQKSLS